MITQGKWVQRPWFDGKAMILVTDDEGVVKLIVAKVEDAVGSDDANLIAAAPDLLAACQHALEALRFIEANQHSEYERGWNEEISELEEAIAPASPREEPPHDRCSLLSPYSGVCSRGTRGCNVKHEPPCGPTQPKA